MFICALFPPPVLLRFVLSLRQGTRLAVSWEKHQYPHHYPHLAPAQSTQSPISSPQDDSDLWQVKSCDYRRGDGHSCRPLLLSAMYSLSWFNELKVCRQRHVLLYRKASELHVSALWILHLKRPYYALGVRVCVVLCYMEGASYSHRKHST